MQDTNTKISCSRGLANWLHTQQVSITFSSYQTGQLYFVGLQADGQISLHQRNFSRAMGIAATDQTIYLCSLFQIIRFENVLKKGEVANKNFDRLFIPRQSFTTGDVDAHELMLDEQGEVIFVNTRYSCLAKLDEKNSFTPIWKPPFISKLAAEDRCHLNGVCSQDGKPKYVTAVSQSDLVEGWRDRRFEGGCIIDVQDNTIVTDKLSMPHSPRLHQGELYVLDSGRGYLCKVDRKSGEIEQIAFCSGFARGLYFHNNFAIVGVSLPRDGAFTDLELQDELKQRDGEAWCAIQIIDLSSGDIVQWIRLTGFIKELFDVSAIKGAACPMAVGYQSAEIQSLITFDDFGDQSS